MRPACFYAKCGEPGNYHVVSPDGAWRYQVCADDRDALVEEGYVCVDAPASPTLREMIAATQEAKRGI